MRGCRRLPPCLSARCEGCAAAFLHVAAALPASGVRQAVAGFFASLASLDDDRRRSISRGRPSFVMPPTPVAGRCRREGQETATAPPASPYGQALAPFRRCASRPDPVGEASNALAMPPSAESSPRARALVQLNDKHRLQLQPNARASAETVDALRT